MEAPAHCGSPSDELSPAPLAAHDIFSKAQRLRWGQIAFVQGNSVHLEALQGQRLIHEVELAGAAAFPAAGCSPDLLQHVVPSPGRARESRPAPRQKLFRKILSSFPGVGQLTVAFLMPNGGQISRGITKGCQDQSPLGTELRETGTCFSLGNTGTLASVISERKKISTKIIVLKHVCTLKKPLVAHCHFTLLSSKYLTASQHTGQSLTPKGIP